MKGSAIEREAARCAVVAYRRHLGVEIGPEIGISEERVDAMLEAIWAANLVMLTHRREKSAKTPQQEISQDEYAAMIDQIRDREARFAISHFFHALVHAKPMPPKHALLLCRMVGGLEPGNRPPAAER